MDETYRKAFAAVNPPKQGHTPGPWKVIQQNHADGDLWLSINAEKRQGYDGNEWVAEIKYLNTDEERQWANARLIAAAPKLLDACVLAVMMLGIEAQIHRENQAPKKAEAVEKAMEVIQAAIDKATQ